MRILVTGHRGYIGSVMVPSLLDAGHRVVGMDVDWYRECTFGVDGPEVPTMIKDIRDVTEADLSGFDALVHLAGLCNDPLGDLNPSWTDDVNYRGSVRLAQLAREAGVSRFLHASSCSLYGAGGHDELLTEAAPMRPQTAYATSKVRTEEAIAKLADRDFTPVFLRNATAYGLSPRLRADVVLNNMVGWAWTTGVIRVLSDGTAWRPLVHVQDIAGVVLAALRAPREVVHNEAFNVGVNEQNYRVADIAEIVAQSFPRCRIDIAGAAQPDRRDYRVDFSKLQSAFPDFRPAWDARGGAQQLRSAIARIGMTVDDFQGRRYTRVTQLKYLLQTGQLDSDLRWNPRVDMPTYVTADAE